MKTFLEFLVDYEDDIEWIIDRDAWSVGIRKSNDSKDVLRKSLVQRSEQKISTWIDQVFRVLRETVPELDFSDIPVRIVFTSVGRGTRALAIRDGDGEYFIEINSSYLTGGLHKSGSAITSAIHEIAHIWLWMNESPEIRRALIDSVKELRYKYPIGKRSPALEYALSDANGDELWAYLIEFQSDLDQFQKEIYSNIVNNSHVLAN